MEPLFRAVVIGLVPQPRQFPPEPFPADDLQRAFFDVSKEHPYQQFQFLPAEAGAQFANSPTDSVTIQTGLIQLHRPVDATPELARERVVAIVGLIAKRLAIGAFMQAGIKVIAHVGVTGSAKEYVGARLLRDEDAVKELGPHYFAGGVKYRSIDNERQIEENLLVEPYVQDDGYLFIDYDVQRTEQFDAPQIAEWLDSAFDFVRGSAMQLLRAEV